MAVRDFNSRLHGRRQFFSHIRHSASLFQLTPSRKATRSRATTMSKSEISTHAFTEGDLLSGGQYFFLFGFQLTPSRKATSDHCPSSDGVLFQLTPSRKATDIGFFAIISSAYFNSRLHGRRLCRAPVFSVMVVFQLTPSRKATANSNNFCC